VLKFNYGEINELYKSLNINTNSGDVERLATRELYHAGVKPVIEPGFIYFKEDGVVSLAINNDPRIIGDLIDSMPIGLLEHYCPIVTFHYYCMTPTTLLKLRQEDFDSIFFNTVPEKMKELTTVLSFMLIFLLDIHVERRSDSSYHTIKSMLYRYLYRQSVGGHENEGIANFILRRTNFSRSYVFRVLADLKDGDYITVKRGRLISINRKLPNDY
jgi:hypothetical protein